MGQALMNLDQLSDRERIDLAFALWDSVGEKGAALPLTSSQAQELDRRVAAYRADGDSGTPWRDCIERAGVLSARKPLVPERGHPASQMVIEDRR